MKNLSNLRMLLFVSAVSVMLAFSSCKGDFPPTPGKPGGGVIIDDPKGGKGGENPGTPGDPGDPGEKPPVNEPEHGNPLPENPPTKDCAFTGKLVHGIDGCRWDLMIELDDDKHTMLYPLNQDVLKGHKEGDVISFGYVYDHEAFTSCMYGWNIEITCLEAAN